MARLQDGWELRRNGDIRTDPCLGYELKLAYGMGIAMRLDLCTVPPAPHRDLKVTARCQTVLTPAAARDLAHALLRSADRAEEQSEGRSN